MADSRQRAPLPFEFLPEVATFTVVSDEIKDGGALSDVHASKIFGVPGGEDLSPQLAWSGFPAATGSFAVTVFDPDAPTGSGFWHWAVANIPASVTELRSGAGDDGAIPEGALVVPNDARMTRYLGAAPPSGHGPHRYVFAVHALDTGRLDVPPDASAAYLGFAMFGHTLARGFLVANYEIA